MKFKTCCLVVLLAIIALQLNGPRKTKAETRPLQCVAGRTAAPVGFWNWPSNSKVSVYLRQPDFSSDYAEAVRIAVENWNATAATNGSNVTFAFKGLTNEGRTGHGDMTIIRGEVFNKKERHLGLLEAHSLKNDQLIDYAVVLIDHRVRTPAVLTNVVTHEIGHTLGLLDCYHCEQMSTAMGLMKSANESNGIDGPTACDLVSVATAYRELAARVKPSPKPIIIKTTEDEGEEPEAEDTPIVRRP